LACCDAFPGLPDDVAHEPGNVDWVFISTLAEIFDEPLLGLVMDKDIVMADAGFSEVMAEKRIGFWIVWIVSGAWVVNRG